MSESKSDKKKELELPLLDPKSPQSRISNHPENPRTHFKGVFRNSVTPNKFNLDTSFFSYVMFADVWDQTKLSSHSENPLTKEMLPPPFPELNFEETAGILDNEWTLQNQTGEKSIWTAAYRSIKRDFWITGALLFVSVYGRLLTTALLGDIINGLTNLAIQTPENLTTLQWEAFLFAVLQFFILIVSVNYWCKAYMMGVKLRLAMTCLIYKKFHSVTLNSIEQLDKGKVVNVLVNNLNDFDWGFLFVWPTLLSPVTVLLGLYYVWGYFGISSLVAFIGMGSSVWFAKYIAGLTKDVRAQMNATTDKRIKMTTELIEGIRTIKMYAWEAAYRNILDDARMLEMDKLLVYMRYDILSRTISESSVYFCMYFMCTLYALIGGVLTPEKVYTSFMMLAFIKIWGVFFFHVGSLFFVSAKVTEERCAEILALPDILSTHDTHSDEDNSLLQKTTPIIFKDYTAFWKPDAFAPCLKNLNLKIEPGKVTAIIGKVGSGKTSFLFSFLQEMARTEGSLTFEGSVAYVEQEPIIFSGTVRQNILFGRKFDENFYQKVVQKCCLGSDIRNFPEQDFTIVGERGVTLSGGQKARISLARALYSRSDIFLLDDPLSAVDSRVAKEIFENVIKGDLLKNKVVILVTHHLQYARESDYCVVMKEGGIQVQGPFKEIQKHNIDILNLFTQESNGGNDLDRKLSGTAKLEDEKVELQKDGDGKKIEESDNPVTWNTYKLYLEKSGAKNLFYVTLALYAFNQMIIILFTRLLGAWALENYIYVESFKAESGQASGFSHIEYILIGLFLIIILCISKFLKVYLTARFTVMTNTNIHTQMLKSITRAMVVFFDQTPIGVILNRFSNDLGASDKQNVNIFYDSIEGLNYLVFFVITLMWVSPVVITPSVIVMLILWRVKIFFAKPTVDSRRLDLISRSPIYSEISQTLSGLTIIRVFKQGRRLIKEFVSKVYENSKALQFSQRTLRLFSLITDMGLYFLTISCLAGYIYVALNQSLDPALFGLAMTLVIELMTISSNVIRQLLNMDINMQSAQRMIDYCDIPSEPEPKRDDTDHVIQDRYGGVWPCRGEIYFNEISMKYRPELPYALKGVDLHIYPGTKVAWVGRTGAGKSSMVQALLRMVEIEHELGRNITIDGIDISDVAVEKLRRSIAIIPQTTMMFTGTIRRNLDPFGEFKEDDLWEVLEEVELKNYISGLKKKLDTDVSQSNAVFSVGQKQLMCLARVLLRRSKLLILDEATANVDIETEKFIQDKIQQKFKDCTIITIAHRLTTIANYDRVLVLEKGKIIEDDIPFRLLVESEEDRGITKKDGVFAKMVIEAGQQNSKNIFELARRSYLIKVKGRLD